MLVAYDHSNTFVVYWRGIHCHITQIFCCVVSIDKGMWGKASTLRRLASQKQQLLNLASGSKRVSSRRSSTLLYGGAAAISSTMVVQHSFSENLIAQCDAVAEYADDSYKVLRIRAEATIVIPSIWESYWEWVSTVVSRLLTLIAAYFPSAVTLPLLLHPDEKYRESWWKLFTAAIQSSGPCSVKLAQWASTRTDLFPEVVCRHFKDLQSNQDQPNWDDIERVFVHHYGPDWNEKLQLERDMDGKIKVLGGGCVAKVLRGKLTSADPKLNGSDIAVKVIHHNVKKSILADLTLLRSFANILEACVPSIKQISLLDSVEEFSRMMLEQVDMRTEARHLDRFRKNFNETRCGKAYDDMILHGKIAANIHFPAPYWEYTNEDVLVESYTPGDLIRDYMVLADAKHKKEIASIGLHTIFKMIFLDNFIHAGTRVFLSVLLMLLNRFPVFA